MSAGGTQFLEKLDCDRGHEPHVINPSGEDWMPAGERAFGKEVAEQ